MQKIVSQPSKELAIDLTKNEKKTLYGFLGLYLGSSLVLIIVIGLLYYSSQVKHYQELTTSKMELKANTITSKIIQAQMIGTHFNMQDMQIEKCYMYGLYNAAKEPIYSQISEPIDFTKKTYQGEDSSFYISDGALGHLGVSYVVIKKLNRHQQITELIRSIITMVLAVYVCIAIIGFYLSKLFIYPIQSQREKLNNFIKDTTHELNTPLCALMLCVDDENFSSEKNRNHIKLSVKKISNLYKDLTYLFLKAPGQNSAKSCDIAKILEKELAYFRELSSKKKLTLSSDIESTFFKIEQEDFIRLISNLISNAIKYTQRNGTVTIVLKNNILTITDTGIGIEKEKLDKIFQRYYRATEYVGGFGIGLSIVTSICQSYHIKINVTSVIKKGTTFTLDFN